MASKSDKRKNVAKVNKRTTKSDKQNNFSKVEKRTTRSNKEKHAAKVQKRTIPHINFYPEENDYFLRERLDSFNVKILERCKMENLSILQDFLTDSQKSLFQESSFGHYLDFKPSRTPLQAIHSLLMYRVGTLYEDEICFKVNDKVLRFSVEEFAVITGLDGWGDKFSLDFNPRVIPRLVRKYFPKQTAVSNSELKNFLIEHKFSIQDDEDAVKLGNIFFVDSIILPNRSKSISNSLWCLGDDERSFNLYPWGRVCFDETLKSLKNAFQGNLNTGYELCGFPYSLLIFALECLPGVANVIGTKVGDEKPKILNWKINNCLPQLSRLLSSGFTRSAAVFDFIISEDEREMFLQFKNIRSKKAQSSKGNSEGCSEACKNRVANLESKIDSISLSMGNLSNQILDLFVIMKRVERKVFGRKTGEDEDVELEKDVEEEKSDESGSKSESDEESESESESGEENESEDNFCIEYATQKLSSSESQQDENIGTQELEFDEDVAAATESEDKLISETDKIVEKWQKFQNMVSENQDEENSLKRKFNDVLSSDLDAKQEVARDFKFMTKKLRTPRIPTLEKSSSSPKKVDKAFKFMKKKVRSPSMPSFSLGFSEDSEEPSQPDSPKLARVSKPSFYKKSPFTDEWRTPASPPLKSSSNPPFPFSSWSDSPLPKVFVQEYKSFINYDYRKSSKTYGAYGFRALPDAKLASISVNRSLLREISSSATKISCEAIDIAFYYLRKKAASDSGSTKWTTTDYLFDRFLVSGFKEHNGQWSKFDKNQRSFVLKYAKTWGNYDRVLMPLLLINEGFENHWFLAELVIDEGEIFIYDSFYSHGFGLIKDHVEMFAKLLPSVFKEIKLKDKRRVGKEPFKLTWKSCPSQKNSFDCGMYVINMAFNLMHRKPVTDIDEDSLKAFRVRLANECFCYYKWKKFNNYKSDED